MPDGNLTRSTSLTPPVMLFVWFYSHGHKGINTFRYVSGLAEPAQAFQCCPPNASDQQLSTRFCSFPRGRHKLEILLFFHQFLFLCYGHGTCSITSCCACCVPCCVQGLIFAKTHTNIGIHTTYWSSTHRDTWVIGRSASLSGCCRCCRLSARCWLCMYQVL